MTWDFADVLFCLRNLPAQLKMYVKLPYDSKRKMVNFYSKLYQTMGVTGNVARDLLDYPEEYAHFSQKPVEVEE